jgi:hypothetical protein
MIPGCKTPDKEITNTLAKMGSIGTPGLILTQLDELYMG